MKVLKYKIIKNKTQYNLYAKKLEELLDDGSQGKEMRDEIDLLTLLIEKWDETHNTFEYLDPIELLSSLMMDHNIKAKNLVEILGISKGYVSGILSYKKGLSKGVIRKLASHFNVSQEAFNRTYKLAMPVNSTSHNTGTVNTKKKSAA